MTQFTEKYKPKTIASIIGHKTEISKIYYWLKEWETGSILLNGSSGIGKTIIIERITKKLNYKLIIYDSTEFKSIYELKTISEMTMTNHLYKKVIVIDAIDKLFVRNGISEIISIIKKSKIPIICISNQITQKIKSLTNHCLFIKLSSLPINDVIDFAYKIAQNENIKITLKELELLYQENNNDLRYLLHNLQFYKNNIQKSNIQTNKYENLDIFTATKKLIGNRHISLNQSDELIFIDYSMIPLMVQESYIKSKNKSLQQTFDNYSKISDLLSFSDIINHNIHNKNHWDLLANYISIISCASRIIPTSISFPSFPSWLGKNSKILKNKNNLLNIASRINYSSESLRLDYLDYIQTIFLHYFNQQTPNIKFIIELMNKIKITRSDLIEILPEIIFRNFIIPKHIKATFTREYNKKYSLKCINNPKN